MRRQAMVAFSILAWLFVVGVVIQVALAGLGLFGVTGMELHAGFGYLLPYVPMVMMIVALVARAGREILLLSLALLILGGFIQPTLPLLREAAPVVAALHPPNALLIFWIGVALARRSTALLRHDAPPVRHGMS